jgi:hypothetical protein
MSDNDPNLMTIIALALERTDPAERAAYCGDDAFLRRRVEARLAAHDRGGRFQAGDATGTVEPTSLRTLDTTRRRSRKRVCRRTWWPGN